MFLDEEIVEGVSDVETPAIAPDPEAAEEATEETSNGEEIAA